MGHEKKSVPIKTGQKHKDKEKNASRNSAGSRNRPAKKEAMAAALVTTEIVKKSNALARARWSAESVWEPRLVALLASKVSPEDTDFQVYELPVSELIEKSEKHSSGRTYLELAVVVERVMSRVITIKDEHDKGWTKYNVFSRCRYRFADGVLELRFDPDLKVHFLNLQKNFAQYNLLEYLMLPSIYSQRIFEILKSWADRPDVDIPLEDLHEMLDTPDSLRNDFAQFRRRVLEKAHKDIHRDTSLIFEWEPIKRGRTVQSIRFFLSPKRLGAGAGKKQKTSQSADNSSAFPDAIMVKRREQEKNGKRRPKEKLLEHS